MDQSIVPFRAYIKFGLTYHLQMVSQTKLVDNQTVSQRDFGSIDLVCFFASQLSSVINQM